MLGFGDAALYRMLRDGAVMKALPMRVISDSPERSVLYLAPDTRFRSARTAAGEKVRDLSHWVSTDLLWRGGSLIRLTEPGAWHCVDVEFGAAGEFTGWYVNFQEPVRRSGARLDSTDLVLDLVVGTDRSWQLKDEDDFRQAVTAGHLSSETEARVREEADRIADVLAAGGPPFCDSPWLSWQPPADWAVPPLPADWDR